MKKIIMFALSGFLFLFGDNNISVANNTLDIQSFKSYKIEAIVDDQVMNFYGVDNNRNNVLIQSFKVATPKIGEDYPKSDGKVVKVDLNPWWYPTQMTKKEFRKTKNIHLPNAIPPGHKLNEMGPFKITLSNSTKSAGNVYRIHGNTDSSSIGKRSSSGCIRMYNDEGREFAVLVKDILKQGKQISVLYI